MPEECIICLGEDDLIKVECKKCNGIYIHQDCFKTLIDRFGRKCPHCRGYLKRENDIVDITESDSSIDSDEAEYYNRVFNERRIRMIQHNNVVNIQNNSNYFLINCRYILANTIYCIYSIFLHCWCNYNFTILCFNRVV